MSHKKINFLIYLIDFLIFETNQIYYISFDLYKVDDCLNNIYKTNKTNKLLYQKSFYCQWNNVKTVSQELSQEEYKFGEEYFFEILDRGGEAYIGINTRINEFLIQPGHQKFWKCLSCKTDDNNYIFNKTSIHN